MKQAYSNASAFDPSRRSRRTRRATAGSRPDRVRTGMFHLGEHFHRHLVFPVLLRRFENELVVAIAGDGNGDEATDGLARLETQAPGLEKHLADVGARVDVETVGLGQAVAVDAAEGRILGVDDEHAHFAHAICTILSACGWYGKVRTVARSTSQAKVLPGGMPGWPGPCTRSVPEVRTTPCQCTVIGSGSRSVTKMRTRSLSTASTVGPIKVPS